MRFGICTTVENSAAVQAAGADFVEEHVQNLLQAQLPDSEWPGLTRVKKSTLPVPAANCLVPGDIKITGPTANLKQLQDYITIVLKRAQQVGIKILVVGSAAARNVPENFDRIRARRQILDFLAMAAPLAKSHGITFVAEPLSRSESNIIQTVSEAMGYVRDLNHPNFQCLVDSYHFWTNDDSLEDLKSAMKSIRHVHVADKQGRVAPGESGTSDYRPFFRVLKEGGYEGVISVEAVGFTDYKNVAPRVIQFLKRQWSEA
jgi:sugar phosphate isomerase/epimerase